MLSMVPAARLRSSGMLADVSQLVRVRFVVEPNYAGWRLDRYLQEKIRALRERVQHSSRTGSRRPTGGAQGLDARRAGSPSRSSGRRRPSPRSRSTSAWCTTTARSSWWTSRPGCGPPTARYSRTLHLGREAPLPGRKIDPAHRIDRETSAPRCGGAPSGRSALSARSPTARSRRPTSPSSSARRRGRVRRRRAARAHPRVHGAGAHARARRGDASATAFEVLERRRPPTAPVAMLACRPGRAAAPDRAHSTTPGCRWWATRSTGRTRDLRPVHAREMTTTTGSGCASGATPSTPGGSSCSPGDARANAPRGAIPDDIAAFWESCAG